MTATLLLPLAAPNATTHLSYYAAPLDGSIPYDRVYPSNTVPLTNIPRQSIQSQLFDLRPLIDQQRTNETAVQRTGFQVLDKHVAKTQMTEQEFADEQLIKTKYYDETMAILKKTTGASKVIIFDHTIRRAPIPGAAPIEDTADSRLPVPFVHVDQTPASGERRVRRHAANDEEAELLLKKRCSLINLWRPLRPVGRSPLVFADARTLNKATDLIPARLLYAPPAAEGETFQVGWNAEHRWYYLNEMTPDEAILLQCWSNTESPSITPHSGATLDEYEGKNQLPRQSIEVRALVFFDDDLPAAKE